MISQNKVDLIKEREINEGRELIEMQKTSFCWRLTTVQH